MGKFIRPLLSICIPTYNRASWLEQILLRMLDICSENCIQIYISDNASSDNTEQIVMGFQERSSIIHYHRHVANIGPDDNFEYVLKMSDTKYRWLMSDTCYVDDIGTLVSDLKREEFDGYIVSAPGRRGKLLPKVNTYYSDSISLLKEIGWHLSWISCMIYNESLVDKMDFIRYKGSSFNQTALMFEPTADRECHFLFNPSIIVKNLPSETKVSGWHYHVFDVMYRQWNIMILSLPLYYPYEAKLKCIEDNSKKSNALTLRFLIRLRINETWSYHDVIRNRTFIKHAKGNYISLLFIGVCPTIIIRFLKVMWSVTKKCLKLFRLEKVDNILTK